MLPSDNSLQARQGRYDVLEHLALYLIERLHLTAWVVYLPIYSLYGRVVECWKEILCQLTMNVAAHGLLSCRLEVKA